MDGGSELTFLWAKRQVNREPHWRVAPSQFLTTHTPVARPITFFCRPRVRKRAVGEYERRENRRRGATVCLFRTLSPLFFDKSISSSHG
jgi:hypothetical protein